MSSSLSGVHMPEMTVKKNDEFFISIAKDEGVHSFILLGVKNETGVHLLARVGKVGVATEFGCKILCKAAFSSTPAQLIDEKIDRETENRTNISYAAYAINYQQYLDFIALLQHIQDENLLDTSVQHLPFTCFKPVQEKGGLVTLQQTSEKTALTHELAPREESAEVSKEVHSLGLTNTCRHSALSLLKYVCRDEQVPHDLSSAFFRNLPLQTSLVADDGEEFVVSRRGTTAKRSFVHPDGKQPFYILPLPPSAFKEQSPAKVKVLTELYQQMESMLKTASQLPETEKKFNLLKELYNDKAGKNTESMSDLLASIKSWRSLHSAEIKVLRVTYFFDRFFKRQSATEKMLERCTTLLEKSQEQSPQN
ncbi:hypothetical protein [Legionella cardiaca]|uniref:Uncharacterized protein n=1 Tax=Legionella cardiaca TaxID=1071983 RepID=A0ABY8AS06_9GAMM|nr:hypothetical protein [Legionella cardiaca]WED43459.1 hypothetical protein PXX05_01415 [Legionella cardiaca]